MLKMYSENIYVSLILCALLPSVVYCLSIDEIDTLKSNGLGAEITASSTVIITSNGVPKGLDGKIFTNIKEQAVKITIPFEPTAIQPHPKICLPNGIIGIAINGVPIYNPYTANCCNAGLEEKTEMDSCWGKLDKENLYYYNVPPLCAFKNECGNGQLVGVALDGFPIYGPYDERGQLVNSSMLDDCHGRDDTRRGYRYHVTADFPYMVGCFRAPPVLPTTCGCEGIRPNCSNTNIGQDIVKVTCCADSNDCSYISNPYYKSGTSTTFSHARVFLGIIAVITAVNIVL